ncbi:mobilization protein, partial [Campylobacter coli]|nr:mobilization protein [Campylobacter coli]
GRYNILWVEHTDKNRLELNFVIPKIDLESKKSFNPYFHMADLKRIEIWQDSINLKHNFTNPKDPAKEQTIRGSKKEISLFSDYEALDRFLHEKVSQGLLTSRKSIVELLRANSIEITREGKDYISVKLPESKKAKRFKGGIYDEQFTGFEKLRELRQQNESRARAYQQRDNATELERIRTELNKLVQSKDEYYREKIQRNIRIQQRKHKQKLERIRQSNLSKSADEIQAFNHSDELLSWNAYNDNFKRDCMVSVDKTLSSIQESNNQEQSGNTLYRDTQEEHHRTGRLLLLPNPIKAENDNIRNRVNSRDREIARNGIELSKQRERVATTIRGYNQRKQEFNADTNAREREISRRVGEFNIGIIAIQESIRTIKERISTKLRELYRESKHRVTQIIERKRKQERHMDRGFFR